MQQILRVTNPFFSCLKSVILQMRLILIFCGIFLKKFLAEKVLGSIENDNQLLVVFKRREQYFLEDICWPWVLLF